MQSPDPIEASSIPYEILRRADGATALSCSAGLLLRPPRQARIRGTSLVIEDDEGVELASLRLMADDVLAHLRRNGRIPFFESMRTGILEAHWLSLRSTS